MWSPTLREVLQSNPSMGICMFMVKAAALYSLEHWLHTYSAVPGSIQPFTLRETVKCVSAFRQSTNNKQYRWV